MRHAVHVVPIEEGAAAAFRRLVDQDPGFTEAFQAGDRVILKPNFVAPRRASTGATTSLVLLREAACRLKDLGAQPVLCETPGMEYSWHEVFRYLGIEELAREVGMEVIECPTAPYVDIRREENRWLRSIRVPQAVLGAKILNLPKLKTHVTTRVTLGAKNLMGLCHNETKRWMHVRGIEPCIADLNRILACDYTIVDGEAAMEGDGGVYGNRRQPNVLIGGTNVAAVDQAACRLMEVDWRHIPHLAALSGEVRADVRGKVVPERFRLPHHNAVYHALYRGLYAVDYLFRVFSPQHFNRWLYRTGRFGTRPSIRANVCDRCEECVKVCPTQCIDLKTLTIDPKSCIRCMDCFDVCPIDAVAIHGFSRPTDALA